MVQAPIAWVARKLLASDSSVQAVMIMRDDGSLLAHERAIGYDESEPLLGAESSIIYYAPGPGLVLYVRTDRRTAKGELSAQIEAILLSPSPSVTR